MNARNRLLAGLFALVVPATGAVGCGGNDTPMVTATGLVFNINKFAVAKLMGTPGDQAFGAALVAGQEISTTLSLDEKSVVSGADGSFSVKVPANSTFYMVAGENTDFVRTQTIIPVTTTNVDLTVPPVIACPEVAETAVLAAGAGLSITDLIARGYAVFATNKLPAPPLDVTVPNTTIAITESADYDLYQFQGTHTGGVEAVKGATSMFGLYGVVPKVKSDAVRQIHITVTDPMGGNTFDPMVMPVTSGFFSSGLALSTH